MNKIFKNEKFIFIIILIIGIAVRAIFIGQIPKGMHVDEAGMGYDALSLATYGVDRYLYKMPVYLINFGGGQSALYAYLAAIFIKVFGFSLTAIRMPSLICSIVAFILVYLIVKENKDKKIALITFGLLAICPWHIMQSRWGLDCNLLSSFIIISLFFLMKAIKNDDIKFYIISGISFGITLYTYALSYIIIPIFLLLLFIYLLYQKKVTIKHIILFGIPLFFIALPLILMILINNGYINEIRTGLFSIPKLRGYRGSEISINNILENTDIFKRLLVGNHLIYNSFPEFGTLYLVSIPFLIIGFIISIKNTVNSIKNKELNFDTIMLILFTSVFVCSLIIEDPNVNKANAIFIPMIYLCVLGISHITIDKIINVIIIILYLISFVDFSKFYFKDYSNVYSPQLLFEFGLIEAIQKADEFEDKKVYIHSKYQTYIYTLFATEMSPYEFQEKSIYDENNNLIGIDKYLFNYDTISIDTNSIYIFPQESEMINILSEQGFNVLSYSDYSVIYKD